MNIIGISGYARSGKDEAAAVLEREFGYTRISFADKIREILYAINPIVMSVGLNISVRLQDVIDVFGWDGYKESPYVDEIRVLLQRTGTEGGRNLLGNDIWVNAAFWGLERDGKYVFADCRFPNEASEIESHDGRMVRIERIGIGPANDHDSEISLDGWGFDCIIHNDGTLDEFHQKIRSLV